MVEAEKVEAETAGAGGGRKRAGRRLVAASAAVALLLGASVAAQAGGAQAAGDTRVAGSAQAAGGAQALAKKAAAPAVGMELDEFRAVVPNPYRPDPAAYFGPHKCNLYIKDYWPTPGCGGFSFSAKLTNVRQRPAFQQGVQESGWFSAKADVSRTFGCTDKDGVFDKSTAFEVKEAGRRFSPVYWNADWSVLQRFYRESAQGDFGPQFFTNFAPVEVTCAAGTTPSQHDLTLTDVEVSFDHDSAILGGHRTWTFGKLGVGSGNS